MRHSDRKAASMASAQLYDTIGATYTVTRRTDPRIAARIWAALGDARTVLNVGAGTGSYEPPDRYVLAVEPSALMRSQRLPGSAPRLLPALPPAPPGLPSPCRSTTSPSTPRWPCARSTTGGTRWPACARCSGSHAA